MILIGEGFVNPSSPLGYWENLKNVNTMKNLAKNEGKRRKLLVKEHSVNKKDQCQKQVRLIGSGIKSTREK